MSKRIFQFMMPILAFSAATVFAQDKTAASSVEEGLRLFAQCDASLFNSLKDHPNMFGPSVQVADRGTAATILVKNPLSEEGREQRFSAPLIVNGLRLVAWHNEVSYDVNMGGFLFWGFKVEGDPALVAKKMNTLLPESKKLIRLDDTWAHSETRSIGDPIDGWHTGGQIGSVTQQGTIERVLMVESDSSSESVVYCSLQGSITTPIVKKLRPDLLSTEYPQ
jgi:hypothetical protein